MLVFRTDGEKWSRLRKALAPKMLRPKDIRENLDNFNSVTRDAIEHMVAVRREDDVIPDLEGELAKYATECKFNLSSVTVSLARVPKFNCVEKQEEVPLTQQPGA